MAATLSSVARQMLKGEGPDSQIVTLTPCAAQAPLMRQQGLCPISACPLCARKIEHRRRCEVLVTSLLDENAYPTAEFLALYGLRWGIESFYGLLKTLAWRWKASPALISAEAVRQDFYATVYLYPAWSRC